MGRALAIIAFLLLVASNGFLAWQLQLLNQRVEQSETRLKSLSSASEQLVTQVQGASNEVELLKAASIAEKSKAPPAPPPNLAQLAIAQSYRLDRVVDWIGLIEDKIFFILFPPPDQNEKDRRALELRGRTEEIRSQFQSVALQEQLLRNDITAKIMAVQGSRDEPQAEDLDEDEG